MEHHPFFQKIMSFQYVMEALFQIPRFYFIEKPQRPQIDTTDRDSPVCKLIGQFEDRAIAAQHHSDVNIIKEGHTGAQVAGIDMMIKILCTLCYISRQKIGQFMMFT